jgi:uncharacterized protein YkwD
MSNDRGLFQPSHTWGPSARWARRKSQIRLGIRKALLSAVLTVAVMAPVRARVEQPGGQAGVERAQATAALQQMQVATAKQAEAVVALQRRQAPEAAQRQAQEEAVRRAQALALQQQATTAAQVQGQAQAAAQAQAEAAALQQRQAEEAAARQAAQAAAQRQAAQTLAAPQGQQFVQPPGGFVASIEQSILSTVNQQRAATGRSPLQLDPTLTATARAHSAQMSEGNRLFHSADLSAGAPPKWRALGENVAMSTSVDTVNARFMESPAHRANILGDFDRVGIGVAVARGRIWVTQEFMQTS